MEKTPYGALVIKQKYPFFKDNVMGEYKKITKEDVDFPRYCHFFIKEIVESLDEYDIKDPGDELELEIETSQYPYCYEAFELVVRTFERKGYDVRIPNFHMDKRDGTKFYTYKWNFRKLPNVEDLPF